jgi:hypothetical protein
MANSPNIQHIIYIYKEKVSSYTHFDWTKIFRISGPIKNGSIQFTVFFFQIQKKTLNSGPIINILIQRLCAFMTNNTGEEKKERQRFLYKKRKAQEQLGKGFKKKKTYHSGRNSYFFGVERHIVGKIGKNKCSHCGAFKFDKEELNCCENGDIVLPELKSNAQIRRLFKEKNFIKDIRSYNNLFSFTSLGVSFDPIMKIPGPFVFKINGVTYHQIKSLNNPGFASIYLLDYDEQNQERKQISSNYGLLNEDYIQKLTKIINEINPFAKSLRNNSQRIQEQGLSFVVKNDKTKDQRRYNLPTTNEMCCLISDSNQIEQRDIVFTSKDGETCHIDQFNAYYEPLMYVLLFPSGESGWSLNIRTKSGGKVSILEYCKYRLQIRENAFNLYESGRLSYQWVVDMCSMMIKNNLNFIKHNQDKIRAEHYQGVVDSMNNGDNLENVGVKVILPSSFTDSVRQFLQLYQDSLALVREFGKPSLFVTITANPSMEENDPERVDLVVRMFKLKLKSILDDIITKRIWGEVAAFTYTIEFQKRGLPHCHLLVFLENDDKLRSPMDIDEIVSAEIPDPENIELYQTIIRCNIHRHSESCLQKGTCSKGFPKQFSSQTVINDDGYPVYKRNSEDHFVNEKNQRIDNSMIVPYNPYLSQKYDCHINVEVCSTVKAVKYIHKYIFKGEDRATLEVDYNDECKNYLDCLHISTHSAYWRIFKFKRHNIHPKIQRLSIHCENNQYIKFSTDDSVDSIRKKNKTHLTEFFEMNKKNNLQYTYLEFPKYFTWNESKKSWTKRKTTAESIGRIYTVSPKDEERFYLRLLLTKIKGPKSFEDVRTVDDQICETFKEACLKLRLITDDSEYFECMKEASGFQSAKMLRNLFCLLILNCNLTKVKEMFNTFYENLSEDFYHVLDEDLKYSKTVNEIEKNLNSNGFSLVKFGIEVTQVKENSLIQEKLSLEPHDEVNINSLNDEQKKVFHEVLSSVENNLHHIFFLDGPGGTGKTYTYNTIISYFLKQGFIVLSVASSGIAATLLIGGKTGHYQFKIPLQCNETSMCGIKKNTNLAELIQRTKLIIWDEAPMMNKFVFETLDRSLQDILGNNLTFGGVSTLLGGDFRQILPVIKHSSPNQIIFSTLNHSYLWKSIRKLKLETNVRAEKVGDSSTKEEIRNWSKFLLDVGEGKIGQINKNKFHESKSTEELINFVYPNYQINESNILVSQLNKDVNKINEYMLSQFQGEEYTFLSIDSVSDETKSTEFPSEFLNSVNVSSLPDHELKLKIGAPITLLRNINPSQGLCNGTRMIVKKVKTHAILAEIISGGYKTQQHWIPKISLISDENLPFEMKRYQFPVKLSFCITAHKAQGQTFNRIGIYLNQNPFCHGILYVLLSRVSRKENISIFSKMETIENTVYSEVLNQ